MKPLTKKEKLAFIKQLEADPRTTDVWYDPNILKRGRDDSIWYNYDVLTFTFANRYHYHCRAEDEVRITYVPTKDDVVSKGCQADDVIEFLEEHGLTTDNKVSKAESRGILYFGNNNSFEDEILDTKTGEWITADNCDVSDGPFSITPELVQEWIDYYEANYYEGDEE